MGNFYITATSPDHSIHDEGLVSEFWSLKVNSPFTSCLLSFIIWKKVFEWKGICSLHSSGKNMSLHNLYSLTYVKFTLSSFEYSLSWIGDSSFYFVVFFKLVLEFRSRIIFLPGQNQPGLGRLGDWRLEIQWSFQWSLVSLD